MRTGTLNNYVQWSKNWGGVRKCYEAKPTLLVGGFSIDLKAMPDYPNVMPAGTPVFVDETAGARSIAPLYTFKVKSVDAAANKITVEKFETGSVAKVGMKLIVVGDDLSTAAANVATISAIDSSASDKDVLTTLANTTQDEAGNDVILVEDAKTKVVIKRIDIFECFFIIGSFQRRVREMFKIYLTVTGNFIYFLFLILIVAFTPCSSFFSSSMNTAVLKRVDQPVRIINALHHIKLCV